MSVNIYTQDGANRLLIDVCQQELADLIQLLSNNAAPLIKNLKIGSIKIKNFYANGDRPKSPKQHTGVAHDNREIPEELNTELAQALWKLAQEHGWVDDQWQPKGLSLTEAAILADEMGAVLKLKCRWKPFEVFWNKKYMRSDFQKAYGQTKTSSIADEMRRVFASVENQ